MKDLEFKGTKEEWSIEKIAPFMNPKHGCFANIKLNKSGVSIDVWGHDINMEETTSNAKLIIAAPKLLKALQGMVKMYEELQPSVGYQGQYEEAISAIEKALK